MKKTIIFLVLLFGGVGFYFAQPFIFQEDLASLTEEEILEQLGNEGTAFVPHFREVEVDFVHKAGAKNQAFVGAGLFDVDGDGLEEVFVGGGEGQQDAILKYVNGEFVNLADTWKFYSKDWSLGALTIDVDNDQDVDLLVARLDDVYFYERLEGVFEEYPLNLQFDERAMPFDLAVADVNNDGNVDLFVSTFIRPQFFKSATFNDPSHVTENALFLGDGEGGFEKVDSGIDFAQNTFVSSFVDLDGDGVMDLVAATNTDRVKIYRGLGDGTFESAGEFGEYGFWMGLSAADYDNDGDLDLFFSNIGNTIPENVGRGDLLADQVLDPEWALWRNDGDFQFVNVNAEAGVAGYEFAWGGHFADMNMDGREDLIVVENYVKWPAHRLNKLDGRFLLQNEEGVLVPVINMTGAENPYYGMTPLVSDFSGDGYPDLIYINLDGPVRAFVNEGGENNYLTVRMGDDVRSLGAKVTVVSNAGTWSKWVVAGTGLLSDQSADLNFGLGKATVVQSVKIQYLDGEVVEFEEVEINSTIDARN